MADPQRIWLQRLTINGNVISEEVIVSSNYIEYIDTSGPLLTLQLLDPNSVIRDDYKLQSGAVIECEFSDTQAKNPVLFKETFISGRPEIKGDSITVDSFSKACHRIKQPVINPRFFVSKSPAFILAELIPGLKIVSDFAEVGTYHLNAGMNASSLIFSMARDYGAAAYICRGTVYFRSLRKLFQQQPSHLFTKNAPTGINIATSRVVDNKSTYDRQLRRQWHCIDQYGQRHDSRANADCASVIVSGIPPGRLENQSLHLMPVIVAESLGVGALQPGQLIETDHVKFNEASERDASMPIKMLVLRTGHYSQGRRYLNATEFGVLNGA